MTDYQIVGLIVTAGFALIGAGLYLIYRGEVAPPDPLRSRCKCGHVFGMHSTTPAGEATPCRAIYLLDHVDRSLECTCQAFEPCRHRAYVVDFEGESPQCIDCGQAARP